MQRTDGGGTPARASLRTVPPQSCEHPQHPQRPEIGDSWARLRRLGLDPERGRPARHLRPAELEETRRATGLEQVLPVLRSALFGPGEPAPVVLAVADPKARVLWLETDRRLRRDADAIGFEPGALWSEDEVGTNGIGLAARTARPSTVHSAEHYLRSHRGWTCVGVPVRDPRTGRLAGVIDLSGPATGDHPYLRQLALTAARLAETELRAGHLEALHRLRTVAVPLLARFGGPALVVDGAAGRPPPPACPARPGWPRRPATGAAAGCTGCRRWASARWSRWPTAGWCARPPRARPRSPSRPGPPPSSWTCAAPPAPSCGCAAARAPGRTRRAPGTPSCSCCWPCTGTA
ncbi:GAF domain-containing protein [Kitasatospora sp. YST-16]|uniref:GAF domain-containing protein n=1 Tax=Kitasatospora sp. YST-16 TaxID=2998080 RepID=UPI002283736A|nr:GAF domain-containing protein [Kitasatospora sp. YST-16]WAL74319.1 GAF domain-containing protein [Kitasatospora sp. YST-16]